MYPDIKTTISEVKARSSLWIHMEDTNIRSDTFHSGDVVFSAVSVLWIAPPPKKRFNKG